MGSNLRKIEGNFNFIILMLLLLALSVSLGCVTLIGLLHYEYFLSKAILRAVSENLIFLWTQEFSKPWCRKGGLCVCTGRKSFLFHPDTSRIYECLRAPST